MLTEKVRHVVMGLEELYRNSRVIRKPAYPVVATLQTDQTDPCFAVNLLSNPAGLRDIGLYRIEHGYEPSHHQHEQNNATHGQPAKRCGDSPLSPTGSHPKTGGQTHHTEHGHRQAQVG